MNKKVIFSIATVSLGVLGILTIVTSNVQFFALVVLVFLFLIAMFVGYSIHQVNENHRRSRKQIQKQVDAIVTGLRKANEVLSRHEKLLGELGDGNAVSFKRVRNDIKATRGLVSEQGDCLREAQRALSTRFTLYYDSLRNVLEDFETYGIDHGSLQALNQDVISTVRELDAKVVTAIKENAEFLQSQSQDSASIKSVADILDPIEKSLETLEKDLRSSLFKGNQSLFNKLQIAMYDETQETEALLHLQSRIEPRAVLPSLGRWAMDAKSMLQLVDLFDEVKPKLVVEIGSGTSSVWLGYLAEEGHAQVVSIENDEGFAERTRAIITDHELEETVNVIYAPLTDLEVRGEEFIWYRTDFIEDLSNIDLLIVDGPPGSTGKHARYPALPVLADKLAPGAVVVLDDTHRKDETQIAEQWSAEYSLKRIDRAMSRLAIFRKTGSEW